MSEFVPDIVEIMRLHASHFHACGVNTAQAERIAAFIDRLWTVNQEFNLVSRRLTLEALVSNHVIDCLAALPHLPLKAGKVADLGTGGGLPAILYAICRPALQFDLYEKSPVKSRFLASLHDLAPNTTPVGPLPSDGLNRDYDWVIARAFKPIQVILTMTRSYADKGGRYFLLKGRKQVIEDELTLARGLVDRSRVEVRPLETFGFSDERHLVLIT